jgi:hypothetical protein
MYQLPQVAEIDGHDGYERTSGRHRLAFLALIHGTDIEIPMLVEDMTIQEARDAVVVANMTRRTKSLEKAEHAAVQATHGKTAINDELYKKMVSTKAKAKQYSLYCVVKNQQPLPLDFKVADTKRDKDALTTITNMGNFWGSAIEWDKTVERAEFDEQLENSVRFINAYAGVCGKSDDFSSEQHMSSRVLVAIGRYYRDRQIVAGDALDKVEDIAKTIIDMGGIASQPSNITYSKLSKALKA